MFRNPPMLDQSHVGGLAQHLRRSVPEHFRHEVREQAFGYLLSILMALIPMTSYIMRSISFL